VSIVVTVRFACDPDLMRAFNREHADLYEQLGEIGRKHGLIGHRQLYREDGVLDIDEWETADGRSAFLEEAGPILRQLAEGIGGTWESTVWQS
jgi:hypothetical protein